MKLWTTHAVLALAATAALAHADTTHAGTSATSAAATPSAIGRRPVAGTAPYLQICRDATWRACREYAFLDMLLGRCLELSGTCGAGAGAAGGRR